MVSSVLEQYRISDLLEWHDKRQLELNPYFQRRSVWTTAAKAYLIDTILRQLPMPKIYMRTRVDLATRRSYREIVDGQQRLRAIIDFAKDSVALTVRSGDRANLRYSQLTPEDQEVFLSYPIAVDQLINASDSDVLEVFARLNSYNLALNAPELRHATYQGDFKWCIHEASNRWRVLWEDYGVLSLRERLRMLDDSLMAEMFGIILEGVTDGGQPRIKRLYDRYDPDFVQKEPTVAAVNEVLGYLVNHFNEALSGSTIARGPHFLMLFAAVAHALVGIPQGGLDALPARDAGALSDDEVAAQNLLVLGSIIDAETPPQGYAPFWAASRGSTQRIASRRVRFPEYFRALEPPPLGHATA